MLHFSSLKIPSKDALYPTGIVTTALPPEAVDLSGKYTAKAKATLAYLHYGMGLPYYRFAKMQYMLGAPIAVSTQSDLMAAMMGPVHPAFNYLVTYAAQSSRLYQDDTGVKIQALVKRQLLWPVGVN